VMHVRSTLATSTDQGKQSLTWRKSRQSTGQPDKTNCIEVACMGQSMMVRDSKHPTRELCFSTPVWVRFMNHLPIDAA
jgi:hypothetical protein